MNDLEKFFYHESDRLIYKWNCYFEFYNKHFLKYRNKKIKLLEIGVYKGGSLQMWKKYFGENAQIIGLDIDIGCKSFQENQIDIFIGNQNNEKDLESLVNKYGTFDIIIDDGSHVNEHQINSFKFLFDYLNDNGIYLVEDLHTSYWPNFGGGYKRPNTFLEFTKDLLDDINGYARKPNPVITKYTNLISEIHMSYSMVFFEKRKMQHTPYDIGCEKNKISLLELIQSKKEI